MILDGERAARAWDAVNAIANDLPRGASGDPTLATGEAGTALFLAHLGRRTGRAELIDRAASLLASAVKRLPVEDPSLFSGYSGVAWVADHVPESDLEPFLRMIDAGLLMRLRRGPWQRSVDLADGLVGIGAYALQRGRRGAGVDIGRVVAAHLVRLADAEGAWFHRAESLPNQRRQKAPNGCYDFGLVHGVPGVLVFLSRWRAHDLDWAEILEPVLKKGARWLSSCAGWFPPTGSRFPARLEPYRAAQGAPLSLAEGDLAVAASLATAARALGLPHLGQSAHEVARRAAQRPRAEAGSVEGGLLHGAAGTAHLLARLAGSMGDASLEDAARGWIDELLRAPLPRRGGLATGAVGVGLALLSALAPSQPSWDALLLLDDQPSESAARSSSEEGLARAG